MLAVKWPWIKKKEIKSFPETKRTPPEPKNVKPPKDEEKKMKVSYELNEAEVKKIIEDYLYDNMDDFGPDNADMEIFVEGSDTDATLQKKLKYIKISQNSAI